MIVLSLSDDQRKVVWTIETNLESKLWGTADNLRLTNPIRDVRRATDLTTASRTQKKKKKKKKKKEEEEELYLQSC